MENEKPHAFVDPEVIEVHVRRGLPMPPGTAKLIWVINQLFRSPDPPETKPASIQYYTTGEADDGGNS